MYKFCHCLAKPIITRVIVSLVLENVVVRAAVSAVLFSETKPIITRIIDHV